MMTVCTTNHADIRTEPQKALLAFLQEGRENAITARELGVLMASRRRKGELIASATSAPYGFYRPEDLREAQECREQLARRLREVRRTVAAYDRAVRRMEWRDTVAVHPLPGMDQGA